MSSVKDQAPFGTCWGFAAIAASEISILAELRELSPAYAEHLADPDNMDLSEHQLSCYDKTINSPTHGRAAPFPSCSTTPEGV